MAGCGIARIGRRVLAAGLLAVALAGCAALGAAAATDGDLQAAGYQNVNVTVEAGTGPAGGVVRVTYSRGPLGNQHQDAVQAERIVWDTFRLRFRTLVIIQSAGGCAGPVCASESEVVAKASYPQLTASFGQRPRNLHASGSFSSISVPWWAIAAVVVLAAGLIVGAVIVLMLITRSGRSPVGSHAALERPERQLPDDFRQNLS